MTNHCSKPKMSSEIWVAPFFGLGHLLPCMELCKHIASRGFKTTLVISSNLSVSIPSSFTQHPLIQILEIPSPPPQPPSPGSDPMLQHRRHHSQMASGLVELLSARPDPDRPFCAILDVLMGFAFEVFHKFQVPTVAFFTSGACSAAMDYATWKAHPEDIRPDEVRLLPGLPEDMALTYLDLKRRPHGPPRPPPDNGGAPGLGAGFPPPPGLGSKKMGPPKPGKQPMWMEAAEVAITLLINTCDDLERAFIDYITHQIGKPVWGVGPLMPEQYWRSAGSLQDREIRTNRRSSVTEDEAIQWLDSKPRGSVLYVSFGSEVGPTMEEYPQLAGALGEWTGPFIWVIQPDAGRSGPPPAFTGEQGQPEEGYYPHGLESKVGERGLIIRGWAPQLLILSHPSTGGFLSHCGWNSTAEAIGRGVPFLAWPIRGDQYYNATLVVRHLKVGYNVAKDLSKTVKKEDIVKGVERLMGDEDVHETAARLRAKFENGFPASSEAALDAFVDFISQKDK
ncbi:scopoletin glucosyltransferase-like [Corylus avellana]|uniref:scopoletin glucosyltransferase-like n=1 Tax=Corylus avellana TaxID=13451 RepID=UPI00286D34C9|nr:scopoletin glucosyltransferase-like [Corylus avellana]